MKAKVFVISMAVLSVMRKARESPARLSTPMMAEGIAARVDRKSVV